MLKDSTLRLDYNGNIKTGTVTVEQNSEITNSTISNSSIKLNNSSVKFERINIIAGQEYTFSCKIYKIAGVNATIQIVSDTTYTAEITGVNEEFFEIEIPIKSTVNYADIYIMADNNYALFSDCMFNKGSKLSYQPYQSELIGQNYKFSDDGLEIESTKTDSKLVANSTAIQIINTKTNKVKTDFNGENTIMDRLTTQERFNIGALRFSKMQNGHIMVTYDEEDG